MRYLGGKVKLAKYICPVLQNLLDTGKYTRFIDAFAGSMNIISGISFDNRLANDINPYIIAVYQHALEGGTFPIEITPEEYNRVKQNPGDYPMWYVGFVGFGCSFNALWFKAFVHLGENRNIAEQANKSIAKKVPKLKGVKLSNLDYSELEVTETDLIYCDIPYKGATGYRGIPKFDHDRFYKWAYDCPATIVVSEYDYNAVPGSKILWAGDNRMSLRNASGNGRVTTEILMML